VEAEPEAAIPALLSGDCDIVVSEEYPGPRLGTPRHLHREVLALDQLDLVASADLLKGQDPLKAAEHLPWALEPVDSASREWAEQHCRNLGFTPMVQYESLDLELLLLLVKQSAAVSILPALVLAAEGSNSSIVRVETGWARTLVLLTRRARREDPSVLAVSSALRRRFHDSSVSLTE
jgi:DNA-binding transcriptional LysR family regulator